MGLPEILKSVLTNYWNFDGRMSRVSYWYWMAVAGLLLLGINVVSSVFFPVYENANYNLGWVWIAAMIVVLIPMVAATARRMQDAGFSSWLLLTLLAPLIGWAFVLGAVLRRGDPGSNKYGEVPSFQ